MTATVRTQRSSGRGLVANSAVAQVLLESVLLKEVLDTLSNDADLARVAAVCVAWRADANALLRRRWDHGTRAVLHGRCGAAAGGQEGAFLRHWGHASVGQLGQVVVSRAGQARSCGQDWDGELCLGGAGRHWSCSWHPLLERVHGQLRAEDIVSVAAGRRHSAFVTRQGALFVAARPLSGGPSVLLLADLPAPVQDVACGGYVAAAGGGGLGTSDGTLARTRCGRLFEMIGGTCQREVELPAAAACVAAGPHGMLTADTSGRLWSWQSRAAQPRPPQLVCGALAAERVVQVSVGQEHSLAVGACGELWAWGRNTHGQLGLGCRAGNGAEAVQVLAPSRVRGAPAVISVGAGTCHSAAASWDGRAYAWGHGNYVGHCGASVALITDPSASRGHPVGRKQGVPRWKWQRLTHQPRRRGRRLLSTPGACPALSPQVVDALGHEPILRVAAGHMGTVAVGRGGKLWSWGPMVVGVVPWRPHDFRPQRLLEKEK